MSASERPGALMQFLTSLGSRWNISLFHYRNNGAAYGRVLCGFEVPAAERPALAARYRSLSSNPRLTGTESSLRSDGPEQPPALTIARESVQMHGAIGVTDEHDLGLYLQRALVLSAWLGNAAQQRRRYAALTRRHGDGGNAGAEGTAR